MGNLHADICFRMSLPGVNQHGLGRERSSVNQVVEKRLEKGLRGFQF